MSVRTLTLGGSEHGEHAAVLALVAELVPLSRTGRPTSQVHPTDAPESWLAS